MRLLSHTTCVVELPLHSMLGTAICALHVCYNLALFGAPTQTTASLVPTAFDTEHRHIHVSKEKGRSTSFRRQHTCAAVKREFELRSDAGLKLVKTGQYFYTLEAEERQQMQHLCREYTMLCNGKGTRIRGWILKNTRTGPVLNRKACCRDDRHSIEVHFPSLFQDTTASWVRFVNDFDKYVTKSMLTKEEEDIASEKPIAKARPQQKPTVTLTSVSIPVLERKWIDIETQRSYDHKCFEASKAITRLPRHDQAVPGGSDGVIQYNGIIEECSKKFDGASQWLLEDGISTLAKGGGAKKRFQYCLNPNSSNQFLYLRAIQGHSGENTVRPELQDNVLLAKELPSTSTTSGTRVN